MVRRLPRRILKLNKKKRGYDVAKNKISKNEFLANVARKHDMSVEDITTAYNAIVDGICDTVTEGKSLSLTGFGSFYLQRHKGHPVNFEGKAAEVKDYVIFKFSASDVLNRRFRDADDSVEGGIPIGV